MFSAASAAELPRIERNEHGAAQFIVDGEPYVALGGELMNSSGSTARDMQGRWESLVDNNVRTVMMGVGWNHVEQQEGVYDFSELGQNIKDARKNGIRLGILWFGAWKNGSSGYVPHWVMGDTDRFPRMQSASGVNRPYVSPFSKTVRDADCRAFVEMMKYIAKVDRHNTVIMVQIENEIGLKGDTRCRSEVAERLFAEDVPAALISDFDAHFDELHPEVRAAWSDAGRKQKGSWSELFGDNQTADELFMAWGYSTYVEHLAKKGKEIHNIPMYVNAWVINPDKPIAGKYPSGGPNSKMLDVWMVGAPSIAFFALDNYLDDYIGKCRDFQRRGNPIFVPEAVGMWLGDRDSAAAKAFYTLAELDALGFCPFGIDDPNYDENNPQRNAYAVLENIMPQIIAAHGTGRMHGFMQQMDEKSMRMEFDDYTFVAKFTHPYKGYGLIIELEKDNFLVVGTGADISITSKIEGKSGLSYGVIQEGRYDKNGEWELLKYICGDEAGQGVSGLKLPAIYLRDGASAGLISVLKVHLVPVSNSTAEDSSALN